MGSGFACVRLNAGNDRNGNPRRLSVLVHPDGDWRVADEGYAGAYNDCHRAPVFETTPKQYRELLREAKKRGGLMPHGG